MFGFITRLRKDAQPKPQKLIGDYAICEQPSPSDWTPRHLRTVSADPTSENGRLHTTGGLHLYDITAICGAELAWDIRMTTRSQIIEVARNPNSTVRYCTDCLDFAGIESSY